MADYENDAIVYYCKSCKDMGLVKFEDTKNITCAEGSKCSNTVFGTYKSIKNFYHLKG